MNTYKTKRFFKRTSTKIQNVLTYWKTKEEKEEKDDYLAGTLIAKYGFHPEAKRLYYTFKHAEKKVEEAPKDLLLLSLSNAYKLIKTLSEQENPYSFTQTSCTPSQGQALVEATYKNLDIQVEFKQYGHKFKMKYKTSKGWVTSASFNSIYDQNILWYNPKSEKTKKTKEFFANGKGLMAIVTEQQLDKSESC